MKKNMYNYFRENIQKISLIILTIVLMVIFFIADGAVWGGDTQGYLSMNIGREAGYSLFLRLFFLLFGEKLFAQAVVAFQLALLSISIIMLTDVITKLWSLSTASTIVIWGIQIFFLLLLKFGSGLGVLYANTLLTEGITYPVYFLFYKAILQINREYSRMRLIELFIYCSILTSIRTQLAVTYIAVIVFGLFKVMARRFSMKKWIGVVLGCLFCMMIVIGGQKIYTQLLYNVPTGTVGSNSFFLTAGLYNAKEEDVNLFESEEEKRWFLDLYRLSCEEQANYQFVESGVFLPLTEHYSQNFDIIKFGVANPYFYEYVQKTQNLDEVHIQIEVDKLSRRIGYPLFFKHMDKKFIQFLQECLRGYMRTVAKAGVIFVIPVVLIYIGFLFLLVCCFGKKEKRAQDTGWSALFILLVSTGNIILTAFMIFCEPRYVLYNMVPFYISGYLLFWEVYRGGKEEKTR